MSRIIYYCRPKRRMAAAVAVSALFFCSAAAFSAVGLNSGLRRLFFFTATVLLIFCFQTVRRYLATSYSYAVYRGDADELAVYEHTLADREPSAVCRICLSGISGLYVKERGRKGKNQRGIRCCNYTLSPFETRCIVFTYTDGDGSCTVRLTYDEGLYRLLEKGYVL